jgi:myo-inositol 2-dehydrogenase/D-chiro-inositol 1-dehydrogenase
MQHCVDCVANDETPLETSEDGRAALGGRERPPIIFAAYESAGTERRVGLPFAPEKGKRPIELWLR